MYVEMHNRGRYMYKRRLTVSAVPGERGYGVNGVILDNRRERETWKINEN